MGTKVVHTCDKCNDEIDVKGHASEFFETKGVLIKFNLSVSGFEGVGCSKGYQSESNEILICKKCYSGIKSKLESVFNIKLMDNKRSED